MPFFCLILLSSAHGAVFAQDPKARVEEYRDALKGRPQKPADFYLLGPGAVQWVKHEPEGLRISLPQEHPSARTGTGLQSNFGMKGDFEITVRYEILDEPEVLTEPQTRLTLGVGLDKPNFMQNQASLSRRWVAGGTQALSWMILQAPGQAKPSQTSHTTPAMGKTGRLRMMREGAELSYLTADGDAEEFTLIKKYKFGAEDIRSFNIVAATGGPKGFLDARITDLVIRAASFMRTPKPRSIDIAPPPKKEYAQEYFQPFKGIGGKSPGWDLEGPEADSCVKFEAEGMRIKLPTGVAGERKMTGAALDMPIKGDFDITMNFEVLAEQKPNEVGPTATRLSLAVIKVNAPKQTTAALSRAMGGKFGRHFGCWASIPHPDKDKPANHFNPFYTDTNVGRLRVVRSGGDLYFATQEGLDGEYRWRVIYPFGPEDVRRIQIAASTGTETAYLDARVTDLRVRADSLPDQPLAPTPANATPVVPREPSLGKGWLVIVLGGGFGVTALMFLAAGVVFFLRRKKPSSAPGTSASSSTRAKATPAETAKTNGVAPGPAPVATRCSSCGKNLKVKAALAGKKIKCPQCGAAVFVGHADAE